MAIDTGTLTVTITESLDMNMADSGGGTIGDTSTSIVKTITVNDIYKRIISVPTSEVLLYDTHDTNVAGATFDDDKIKYVRITNHEAEGGNHVVVRLKNADNDEFVYKLEPKESFLLYHHEGTMNAAQAATIDIGTGWHDISSVKLTAQDGAVDCEVFIACSA